MAATQRIPDNAKALCPVTPRQHYSVTVKFIDRATDKARNSTTFEIYAVGNNWYCRVRCGDQKTRPMGPFSKQQAERMQDTRRWLIAKSGIAGLISE